MTEAAKQEILPPEETVTPLEDTTTVPDAAETADTVAEQLKVLTEEVAKFKDLYLRAAAETENVRVRARRDIEENTKYAVTKFARDIVTIVENLQRASSSISAEARANSDVLKQVGDGIDMTMQEMLAIFERNGIKRVNPEGQKFDHNFHQAVAQVESAEVAPGNVLQVLQAGYVLHDRLLKPAMVTVASKPAGASA